MKRLLFILSFLGIAYLLNPKTSAASNSLISDVGIQFGFFYSSLAPHGEWIEVESGIRVWRPFHIPHQWRPYLIGRWVWTDDYGWYWMSNEPFGWITYHYGRWYYDDYYGWVWMPDDVWAPAWVEWRYDDDYIGWAPLPPYATFHMTFGIRFTTHWIAPTHYWNFVRYHQFGSVIRYRDTAPENYARRLIHTGRTGQQFGIDHERIINRGVDRAIIELRGNLRFTKTEVRETREQSGERMIRSNDNLRFERIEVYRPSRDEMQRNAERIEMRRGERNLSIDINKVERPHVESRTPSDERLPRNETKADAPLREPGISREIQQTEHSRERTPQMHEQQLPSDRQEKRRELIQRHERKQNPSPPAAREARQQRIERRKESSRITQPSKPDQERRSENKSERRRVE
jgi:hypothetical protein